MIKTILSHRCQIGQHLRLLVTRQHSDNNVLSLGNFRDRSYHSRWVLEVLRHELPFTWEWFTPYFFVLNTFNVQLNQWFCPVRLVPGTNVIMFWGRTSFTRKGFHCKGMNNEGRLMFYDLFFSNWLRPCSAMDRRHAMCVSRYLFWNHCPLNVSMELFF